MQKYRIRKVEYGNGSVCYQVDIFCGLHDFGDNVNWKYTRHHYTSIIDARQYIKMKKDEELRKIVLKNDVVEEHI